MKNCYKVIVSSVLLLLTGSCFAAEAEDSYVFSGDRASLDERMRVLKTQLDEVKKELRAAEDSKKKDGVLLPLKLRAAVIKGDIMKIALQIKSLKASIDEEYVDVKSHALPLDTSQVVAANAANKNVVEQARLKRILDARTIAMEQLERLRVLEDRFNANSGVIPEDTFAELTLLREQKAALERNAKGLAKCEEKLEKPSRIKKRKSEEALDQSNEPANVVSSQDTDVQKQTKVKFGDNIVASILHKDDAENEDEQQPDLAAAHDAAHHKGSSRRNAAYVVQGLVVTPLVADGSVVAQLPQSELSETLAKGK
jgi:hypothetical protein